MKFSICFVDLGLEFDGENFEKKSLGGSETALYYMSKEMAARGHDVHVVNKCKEPSRSHGVTFHPVQAMNTLGRTQNYDVVIANRFGHMFTQPMLASMRVQWCHDTPPNPIDDFVKDLWAIDRVFLLSDFHHKLYRKARVALPEGWIDPIVYKTRNGIDLDLIRTSIKGVKKHPKKLMYASRPERGMQILLESIWPMLLEEDDELLLTACTYYLPDHMTQEPYRSLVRNLITALEGSKNAFNLGNLSKEDLYKHLAESQLLIYPCHFPEISCIMAMESMACGTPVVTTDNFALSETCAKGAVLIDGMPRDKAYQKKFVKEVVRLLNDEEAYKALREEGLKASQNRDWSIIATEWDGAIHEFFQNRFNENKHGIFRQLMHDSDVYAAKLLSERYRDDLLKVLSLEELTAPELFLKNQGTEPERYSQDDDLQGAFAGWDRAKRFEAATSHIPEDAETVLDVGCNVGMGLAWAEKSGPNLKRIVGLDFSAELINKAKTFTTQVMKQPGKVEFKNVDIKDYNDGPFDVVMCLETLEHIVDWNWMIEHLERLCVQGGTIILTLPYGPWESMHWYEPTKETLRDHCHHWHLRDIINVFGGKKGFNVDFAQHQGMTARGEMLGNWVVYWKNNSKKETGKIDYEHKWLTTRPYKWITGEMIVKNEEDWISGCLKSVALQVDEIIVYDTGSNDMTQAIVENFAKDKRYPKVKYIKGDPINEETGGFAGARNRAASYADPTCDWHLWFDADERLLGGPIVRMAAGSILFPGFVITQSHLIYDLQAAPDTPVRMFRKGAAEFLGFIHEHPEKALNHQLAPVVQLPRCTWIHYGYPTESLRREKEYNRNLPLLLADRKVNKDRIVGLIFLQRTYINLANWAYQKEKGLSAITLSQLRMVIKIYMEQMEHLENDVVLRKYWARSFGFYQEALGLLGKCTETLSEDPTDHAQVPFELVDFTACSFGGLDINNMKIQPNKRWFRDKEEYERYVERSTKSLKKQMSPILIGEYLEIDELEQA